MFTNRSLQRLASAGAVVIGVLGMVSSVYLATKGAVWAVEIVPGAVMFGMGLCGLFVLSKPHQL